MGAGGGVCERERVRGWCRGGAAPAGGVGGCERARGGVATFDSTHSWQILLDYSLVTAILYYSPSGVRLSTRRKP